MIMCRALSYEENTLDKSLLKNLSCKSTGPVKIYAQICLQAPAE